MLDRFLLLFNCYGFVAPGLIHNTTNLHLTASISSSTLILVLSAKLGSCEYHFLNLWYDSTEYRTHSPNCKAYLLFLHSFKERPVSKCDFSMNFSIKERRFVNECNVSTVTSYRPNAKYTDIFYHESRLFYKRSNNLKSS